MHDVECLDALGLKTSFFNVKNKLIMFLKLLPGITLSRHGMTFMVVMMMSFMHGLG